MDADEAKLLLADAERNHICETTNDASTGAIRYRFDV